MLEAALAYHDIGLWTDDELAYLEPSEEHAITDNERLGSPLRESERHMNPLEAPTPVASDDTSPELARPGLVIATMCLAVVLVIAGVASLNVAVPTIGRELGASQSDPSEVESVNSPSGLLYVPPLLG